MAIAWHVACIPSGKTERMGEGGGLDRSMNSTSRPLRWGGLVLSPRGLESYNLPQRSQKEPLSISKLAIDKNAEMNPFQDDNRGGLMVLVCQGGRSKSLHYFHSMFNILIKTEPLLIY